MEVRIGVVQSPKEIEVELAEDTTAETIISTIESALANEAGILWLTDKRGRRVGIPSSRVAYIEVDANEDRRVGFGAR